MTKNSRKKRKNVTAQRNMVSMKIAMKKQEVPCQAQDAYRPVGHSGHVKISAIMVTVVVLIQHL